ncbi:MAG: hypothetical protein A3G26_09690 [Betaproteobacteria bacterium RIFCSPLOWO2_12_FULL_65_110]|nr:MAG: hypothetical protein A3G26_09690 [Betaproteobacteria bacterium RIFCSPLOWO2_12_FULL_65_110]
MRMSGLTLMSVAWDVDFHLRDSPIRGLVPELELSTTILRECEHDVSNIVSHVELRRPPELWRSV